jgi:hypothetical protein
MLILYKLPYLLEVKLIFVSLFLSLIIGGVYLRKQWIFRSVSGSTLNFEFLCQHLQILYCLFIPVSLSHYSHLLLLILLFHLLSLCGSWRHILKQVNFIFFILWCFLRGLQALLLIWLTIIMWHLIVKPYWSLLVQLLYEFLLLVLHSVT